MVGLSGIKLCEDGAWKKEYVADLAGIDAGTDSGPTFASPDSPTDPWEPVTRCFYCGVILFLKSGGLKSVFLWFSHLLDDWLVINRLSHV